jgi:hypothetical protein
MDLNLIKNKLNNLQSTGQKKEKVDYTLTQWKPRSEGKYQIRFVPSKFDKSNPFKEVYLHYGYSKFPIYALTNWGEKDPIVEFAKQLRGTNDRANWQLAKKLDPKMRVFAPIIVRGEEEKGVRLWEFGKETYMQLLALAEDEDYGDFTDIHEGFDFTLEAVMGDVGGRQALKSSVRPKRKTSPLSENASQIETWLENQPNILELQERYKKSFDDLKTILQNFLDPEEEEDTIVAEPAVDFDDEIKEEPKSNYSLSTKKDIKKPVDKFDALFDEDEDDDMPF